MLGTYNFKKITVFKCAILVLGIVILIFTGRFVFNLNRPMPRNVAILIGGGGGAVTLFELSEDTAQVTVFRGSRWFYNDFLEGDISRFSNEILYQYELGLLDDHLESILNLAGIVSRGRANRTFRLASIDGHIDYAWAIIDGRRYWSIYHSDIDNASSGWRSSTRRYTNRSLLYLIYELLDASPIPLYGGDNWPLRPR